MIIYAYPNSQEHVRPDVGKLGNVFYDWILLRFMKKGVGRESINYSFRDPAAARPLQHVESDELSVSG